MDLEELKILIPQLLPGDKLVIEIDGEQYQTKFVYADEFTVTVELDDPRLDESEGLMNGTKHTVPMESVVDVTKKETKDPHWGRDRKGTG